MGVGCGRVGRHVYGIRDNDDNNNDDHRSITAHATRGSASTSSTLATADEMAFALAQLRSLARQTGTKADKVYADAIYQNLSTKFVQLATVASRNIEMLAALIARKADSDSLSRLEKSVRSSLKSMSSTSKTASAAAGKLHFRCLTCNRFTRKMAGPATA